MSLLSLSRDALIRPAAVSATLRTARVTRLAAFFLLVALCACGIQEIITAGLRHIRTSDFGVSNRVFDGQVNAEIVISGSSRAYNDFDPRIIARLTGFWAFDIGKNGSQTDMQVAVLKAYLHHNRPPRLVIHTLDLFSFLTSHEIFDPAQYLPYLGEDSIYQGIRRVYPDAWKWKYIPLYGYAVEDMRFDWLQGPLALLGRQPPEDDFLGYHPRDTHWSGEFAAFRDRHRDIIHTAIEPRGVADLIALVQVCRERRIPLLFVYAPEFRDAQILEADRADVFARFDAICNRYHVPLWDYSASSLCNARDNFANSQHLNADGAERFTRDLAARLKASGLLPLPPGSASSGDRGGANGR